MRSIWFLLCVVTCALCTPLVRADGMVFQLPEDGHWVRFDIAETGSGPHEDGGQSVTMKGTLTISSVGATDVQGERCRWIEIVLEARRDGQSFTEVGKLLVPERHVGRDQRPLEHFVEAWHKHSMLNDGAAPNQGPRPFDRRAPERPANRAASSLRESDGASESGSGVQVGEARV